MKICLKPMSVYLVGERCLKVKKMLPLLDLNDREPRHHHHRSAHDGDEQCRAALEAAPRDVVALYANPKVGANMAKLVTPLNALGREQRVLISQLSPFDFYLSPSTTKADLLPTLQRFRPHTLLISGHTLGGKLLLEDQSGRLSVDEMVSQPEMEQLVLKTPSLELVVLMACESTRIRPSDRVLMSRRVRFITWSTVTEDEAALAFTAGAIQQLAREVSHSGRVNAAAVFEAGLASFTKSGFRLGDPYGSDLEPDISPENRPHGIVELFPN
jgi:hypothetical protein